ncbi:DUF7674 family protein [Chitinophaga sp. NPDC101104]|uniref:DUF7674 family protein n=1 Tax=Chitinophaga sp. NPDC101104 TaxID=3390561 RepID=UPI003D04E630
MLNTYEVPALIEDALPELHKPLRQFPAIFHLYETMECLRDHTLRQWRDENFPALEKCLRVAGRLYERGNQRVRDAVERIIVPGISHAEVAGQAGRIRLFSLVPAPLYNLFIREHLKPEDHARP